MTHRDRESEVVRKVAEAMWHAWDEYDAASGVLNTVMARAAIRETLRAMEDWCGPETRTIPQLFAKSLSISLSPQEKEGNDG